MWSEIIGHTQPIAMLRAALSSGKVPHAMLFSGPQGIGKLTVARAVAADLLKAPIDSHPDLTVVSIEGNSIKIDQIRNLKRQASHAPYAAEWQVCILENAERMTREAANSFLKLLEEPPAYMVFILVASTAAPLLPTIVSRCRLFRFLPLPHGVLADALTAKGFDREQADLCARLGEGRLQRALSFLQPGGLTRRDEVMAMVERLPTVDMQFLWDLAVDLTKLEAGEAESWRRFLLFAFRDLLVYCVSRGQKQLLLNIDQTARLAMVAEKWDAGRLQAALTAVRNAERALAANANSRLTYEALLIQLRELVQRQS